MIVPRTVTTVEPDASPGRRSKLSDFRDERFYVLLGSPGAGKTTAFEAEAGHVDDSLYLTARQVVRSHTRPRSEWREKTLFIDGLDEVRAGEQDVRKPLDCILDLPVPIGRPSRQALLPFGGVADHERHRSHQLGPGLRASVGVAA